MKIPHLFFGMVLMSIASFAGAATHVVKSGDTFYRIAKNYGISVKKLEQANPRVNPNALRIGGKLEIPGKTEATSSETVASSPTNATQTPSSIAGTYEVKSGDNLSKIARAQNTTVAALQAANPGLNPTRMAIGQKIQIPGASPSVASSSDIAENTAPAPAPVQQFLPENHTTEQAPAPTAVPEPTVAQETPAAEKMPVPATQSLNPGGAQTVQNPTPEAPAQPAATTYRLIKTTRELTLAEVAKEHNTTPEKINSLNGWSFSPQTLLAVDSELYIPAQP